MSTDESVPLTPEELAQEGVTALPDKEVISILDLAADVDLAIDGAAPIDLAVALNANVVAPIDAAVGANLLSDGSTAEALADQGVQVTQTIDADAVATGIQDSTIDQSDTVEGGTAPAEGGAGDQTMLAAGTEAGGDTADGLASAASEPVDGSVVVDSAGNIIGTLDSATGNVVGSGRRHPRHGQRGHRRGGRLGRQPDRDGHRPRGRCERGRVRRRSGGGPRCGDRQRARRIGQRDRDARPPDRRGPQHGGFGDRHRDGLRGRHHRPRLRRQRRRDPRRCHWQRGGPRRQRDRVARAAHRAGTRRRRPPRGHGRRCSGRRHGWPRPARHRRPAQGQPAQRRRQCRPRRGSGSADQRCRRGQRQHRGAHRRRRVGQHPVRELRGDRDRPAGRDHHPDDHRQRGGDLRPGLQHRPGGRRAGRHRHRVDRHCVDRKPGVRSDNDPGARFRRHGGAQEPASDDGTVARADSSTP